MTRLLRIDALLAAAALSLALTVGAFAQAKPDQTGTGGGPGSTITAPNKASTGATVPSGGSAAAGGPVDTTLDKRVRRQDRKLEKSICSGCR